MRSLSFVVAVVFSSVVPRYSVLMSMHSSSSPAVVPIHIAMRRATHRAVRSTTVAADAAVARRGRVFVRPLFLLTLLPLILLFVVVVVVVVVVFFFFFFSGLPRTPPSAPARSSADAATVSTGRYR